MKQFARIVAGAVVCVLGLVGCKSSGTSHSWSSRDQQAQKSTPTAKLGQPISQASYETPVLGDDTAPADPRVLQYGGDGSAVSSGSGGGLFRSGASAKKC